MLLFSKGRVVEQALLPVNSIIASREVCAIAYEVIKSCLGSSRFLVCIKDFRSEVDCCKEIAPGPDFQCKQSSGIVLPLLFFVSRLLRGKKGTSRYSSK